MTARGLPRGGHVFFAHNRRCRFAESTGSRTKSALDSIDLVAHQLSITGSFMTNRATMREMLAFAHGHSIAPRVELMPMSQVNGAIQRLRENKARYRIVLVNDPDDAGTATERPA